MYKFIKVEKIEHQFILTLARPEKRNAFTPTMVNEIHHAFEEANDDDKIKLVIIKAEGPIFCAGMDLKTFENPELDVKNPAIQNENISLGEVFDQLLKPSIALVEGNVIAGGFLIILGCTYVFCNQNVQFKLPELEIGLFPFQVMASLLKVMPEKKALQLCLETNYFDAIKAEENGIVDGFIDENDLNQLINSYDNKSTKAIKSGIESLRYLPSIPDQNRYQYLKNMLEKLKENN
ncbi:enoyl-CoA hydratase/isomerase family protein [Sphingobacterium bovistauri]|uniref:Enoyl-CoA hydratase/isomerase family protein n=1 Tax=Sphingobacterium bovistauri TaxID=2781959 RepID=A0ABS7Z951_9SPHI|nr:enoyl-CoA hydratase/isomerase family protein [Sphingobacterium bovistauri]MCA5005395.1 enoyl-CoA hydratase/isomerase family protein [Sphingobacterium bovistauri]